MGEVCSICTKNSEKTDSNLQRKATQDARIANSIDEKSYQASDIPSSKSVSSYTVPMPSQSILQQKQDYQHQIQQQQQYQEQYTQEFSLKTPKALVDDMSRIFNNATTLDNNSNSNLFIQPCATMAEDASIIILANPLATVSFIGKVESGEPSQQPLISTPVEDNEVRIGGPFSISYEDFFGAEESTSMTSITLTGTIDTSVFPMKINSKTGIDIINDNVVTPVTDVPSYIPPPAAYGSSSTSNINNSKLMIDDMIPAGDGLLEDEETGAIENRGESYDVSNVVNIVETTDEITIDTNVNETEVKQMKDEVKQMKDEVKEEHQVVVDINETEKEEKIPFTDIISITVPPEEMRESSLSPLFAVDPYLGNTSLKEKIITDENIVYEDDDINDAELLRKLTSDKVSNHSSVKSDDELLDLKLIVPMDDAPRTSLVRPGSLWKWNQTKIENLEDEFIKEMVKITEEDEINAMEKTIQQMASANANAPFVVRRSSPFTQQPHMQQLHMPPMTNSKSYSNLSSSGSGVYNPRNSPYAQQLPYEQPVFVQRNSLPMYDDNRIPQNPIMPQFSRSQTQSSIDQKQQQMLRMQMGSSNERNVEMDSVVKLETMPGILRAKTSNASDSNVNNNQPVILRARTEMEVELKKDENESEK